jgi:hypothetical protein
LGFLPVLFWVLEEAIDVDVVEQMYFAKTNQIRESPLAF